MKGLHTIAAAMVLSSACFIGSAMAQDARPHKPARASIGLASFYDKAYKGKTASGARYDGTKFTAAHRTLPFGTKVLVTDRATQRSVTVVVNDRGPFVRGRIIDLSYAAAKALKMEGRGVIRVSTLVQ